MGLCINIGLYNDLWRSKSIISFIITICKQTGNGKEKFSTKSFIFCMKVETSSNFRDLHNEPPKELEKINLFAAVYVHRIFQPESEMHQMFLY